MSFVLANASARHVSERLRRICKLQTQIKRRAGGRIVGSQSIEHVPKAVSHLGRNLGQRIVLDRLHR